MKQIFTALIMVVICLGAKGEGGEARASNSTAKISTKIIKTGNGPEIVRHSNVTVHYTGWLANGTKFDSSLDRGEPFNFTIGTGSVIPGWDIGIEGMKPGEKRELIIPPALAYGSKGAGKVIPPNATLRFEVNVLTATPPKYQNIDSKKLKYMLSRGVKIMDIRRPDEWRRTGIVKGSERLTAFDGKGRFVKHFPTAFGKIVKPDDKIILICRTGNRSAILAHMLTEKAGYKKVYNVKDGISKWIEEKNPVIRQ